MSVPLGKYPGGFHLEDFAERFTNQGAEVTLTFIGPSTTRWTLLGEIFGEWVFTDDPATGVCCYDLVGPPHGYADVMAIGGLADDCGYNGYCLWPDTFEISKIDQSCSPEIWACPNEPPLSQALDYPLYYGNGSGAECACRIQVNYRRKYHASWPRYMHPCGQQDDWRMPTVPTGTYIEVRRNPAISAKVLPDSSLKYVPTEEYRTRRDVSETDNCTTESIGLGNVPNAGWCNTSLTGDVTVPTELSPGPLVFAQELEVRWSNVPVADWSVLQQLEGTLNETVWFGYPPESVLFGPYDIEEQPYFGCTDLYTIVLHLNVMTGLVDGDWGSLSSEEQMSRGIYKGRVGLWNRIWSDEPMFIDDSVSPSRVCTHWVPVRAAKADCCGSAAQKIHLVDCFDRVFNITSCIPPP